MKFASNITIRSLVAAARSYSEDRIGIHSAALAYYTILSIAPLLVIAIAVAGWLIGTESATTQITAAVQGLVGEKGAAGIEVLLTSAKKPAPRTLAAVLGLLTLFFGASGVFVEIQDSLNAIWKVTRKRGTSLKGLVKSRFVGFTMVLGTGFLFLVSLLITAVITGLEDYLRRVLPLPPGLLQFGNTAASIAVASLLFGLIFKVLPDVTISWRSVWTGALLTGVLFTVGKTLIGLYLGNSSFGSIYGAAGSLIVVLVWVYYSSQILFFGAEFTKACARLRGETVKPREFATFAEGRARPHQRAA